MITVNIKGGLGNQMFQYAAGRALALRNDDELSLTRSEYQGDIERPFSLTAFNITGNVIPLANISLYRRLVVRLRQKLTRDFFVNFDPSILVKKGDTYLDGYFQSEKYFSDAADTIKRDFTLKETLQGAAAEAAVLLRRDERAVSLHVRRGDYVDHPEFGGVATKAYYEEAMRCMRDQVTGAHFYIFSDDIAWCRDHLPLDNEATFISQPEFKDYEELVLMSLAQHHIIANSSFSWWSAWLGRNPHKSVIAPRRWSNLHEDWYRDIIPASWIRI